MKILLNFSNGRAKIPRSLYLNAEIKSLGSETILELIVPKVAVDNLRGKCRVRSEKGGML